MEVDVAAPQKQPRKTGRPLSFDREAALEKAMLTFWKHGYETTSINDLTRAMGVTPPSLYAAFGDKRRLFLEAVRLYAGDPDTSGRAIDGAATAYDAARELLVGAAVAYTGDATPPGCLLASATASGSEASRDMQAVVTGVRQTLIERLQVRIERDIESGTLPARTDPGSLAALVMTLLQGLSVMARDGLPRASLLGIVDAALDGWPSSFGRR